MNQDRLIKMANQIATFFATQPGDQAAKATAEHIRSFWDPRMRRGIMEHVAAGGEGLDPVALTAVRLLMDAEATTVGH
jgi:formate dehydrogenase subunit delta